MQKIIRTVALIAVFLIATNITYAETSLSSAIDLNIGDTSPIVFQLQKYLNSNGYIVNSISGQPGSIGYEVNDFGIKTKQALIQFQKDKGINPATGFFGPKTKAKIAEATNLKTVSVSTTTPGKVLGAETATNPLVVPVNYSVNSGDFLLSACDNMPYTPDLGGAARGTAINVFGPYDVPAIFNFTGSVDDNFKINDEIIDKKVNIVSGSTCSSKHNLNYTKTYPANTPISIFVIDQHRGKASLTGTAKITRYQKLTIRKKEISARTNEITDATNSLIGTIDAYPVGSTSFTCGIGCTATTSPFPLNTSYKLVATSSNNILGKSKFVGWEDSTGVIISTNNEYTDLLDTDTTISAVFQKQNEIVVRKLIVDGNGNYSKFSDGVVEGSGQPYDGSPLSISCIKGCDEKMELWPSDIDYKLTASSSDEYRFVEWKIFGVKNSSGDYNGQMVGDITIDAVFKKAPKLTINFVDNTTYRGEVLAKFGVGTSNLFASLCKSTCTVEVDANTTVALTAIPDKGYRVVWGGGIPSGETDISVDMDQDKTVNIKFVKQYQLTLDKKDGNSGTGAVAIVSPENKNSGLFDEGTNVTISATPEPGSRFAGWEGEKQYDSPSSTSTVTTSVTMNTDITKSARFIKQYKIETTTTGTSLDGKNLGEVTGFPNGGFADKDSTITLVAKPLTSSFQYAKFKKWSNGPCQGSTTANCTFSVTKDENIVAEFTLGHKLTLVTNPEIGGIITGTNNGEILDEGDRRTLLATPNPEYKFVAWTGEGSFSNSNSPSMTVTMGSKDITVTANFAKKTVPPKVTNKSGSGSNGSGTTDTRSSYRNNYTPPSSGVVRGFSWKTFRGFPVITSAPVASTPAPAVSTPTPVIVAPAAVSITTPTTTPISTLKTLDSTSSTSSYYEVYTITATPNAGSKFVGFEGCTPTVPGGNVCEVIGGDTAAEITAIFAEITPTYTLTIGPVPQIADEQSHGTSFRYPGAIDEVVSSTTPSGIVVSTPSTRLNLNSTTSQAFSSGTKITLTATEIPGIAIGSSYRGVWIDCPTTSTDVAYTGGNVCTFTINKDVNPKYQFVLNNYNFTVKQTGSGSGYVTGVSTKNAQAGSSSRTYIGIGSFVVAAGKIGAGGGSGLKATPDAGSVFTGWTGCDSVSLDLSSSSVCTISFDSDNKTVTANFEKISLAGSTSTLIISTTTPSTLFLTPASAILRATSTLILNPSLTSPARSLPIVMPSAPAATVTGPFAPSYAPVVGPLPAAPVMTLQQQIQKALSLWGLRR